MTDNPQSIHQFKVSKLNGANVNLDTYENKVLLVVNIASECGFVSQLQELEELRETYKDKDFEILAFPSNDFGRQEPLEGEAINQFCQVNYGVTFPVFEKTMVRGEHAHPLFKFLADKKLNGVLTSTPRWNFHKYLINKKGEVVDYFFPFTKPLSSKVKKQILRLL
jgi:glutathione peroxidase